MSMKNIASNKSSSFLSMVGDEQVQPNAVDIKIDKLFEIKHENEFVIDEENKQHRGSVEIFPDEDGYFHIDALTSYEFLAEGEVSVGPDEAGWVITRSTLNRNGIFLTSGLYDSGYHGVMAGVLHNNSGSARIAKGTRVGQFLLYDAEALSSYDGDYGKGKADDLLYKAGLNISEVEYHGPPS